MKDEGVLRLEIIVGLDDGDNIRYFNITSDLSNLNLIPMSLKAQNFRAYVATSNKLYLFDAFAQTEAQYEITSIASIEASESRAVVASTGNSQIILTILDSENVLSPISFTVDRALSEHAVIRIGTATQASNDSIAMCQFTPGDTTGPVYFDVINVSNIFAETANGVTASKQMRSFDSNWA